MAQRAPQPGDELDIETWLADGEGDGDEPEAPQRGLMMRHPLLLLAVLAGSVFLLVQSAPRAAYMFTEPVDCGDITQRPIIRAENPDALPALQHDTMCRLTGVVQSRATLATGEAKEGVDDLYAQHAGRKYFVKLDGDKVFAVLAADQKSVVDHRLRKGSMFGYAIDEVGRMLDPDGEPGYEHTARVLRLKFSIADDVPIRIFDTTDDPGRRWPFLAISIAMGFTALLALFGLVRLVLSGRESDA